MIDRAHDLQVTRQCQILKLARKVIELTGSRPEIVFLSLPSDDPTQRKPDITLAKSALGWEPAIALEQGLKKTIAYFSGATTNGG